MSKKKILALLVTILFLGFLFYKIDLNRLIETFKLFNPKHIWTIVICYVLTLYLRGFRWKALLLDSSKYTAFNLAQVFTIGNMMNVFLPARAGDIYRAYYLGTVKKEKKMKMFGSVILERTFDGICVFLLLLCGVLFYFKQPWIIKMTYLTGALFLGTLTTFYLIFKFNKVNIVCNQLKLLTTKFPKKISQFLSKIIDNLCKHAESFIEGLEALDYPICLTKAFIISVIVWILEAFIAYMVINSFVVELGIGAALFVMSFISFSSMLPSTSIFLGPYQVAYVLALGIYDIDKSTTLAISTVHQMLLMIILTILGLYFWNKLQIKMQDNIDRKK